MSNIKSLSTTLLILRITQNWWRDKEEYVKLIAATSVKSGTVKTSVPVTMAGFPAFWAQK